jgi:hypothetical protein
MHTDSVVDPGSDAFLTPVSWMGKKSGSGSGMNNISHISKSLETIFLGLKYLKFFDADPGSGTEKIRIRIRINSADPQHCILEYWKKKNRLWLPYPTTGEKLASLCVCIFDVNVQNKIQNKCTGSGSDQENLFKFKYANFSCKWSNSSFF